MRKSSQGEWRNGSWGSLQRKRERQQYPANRGSWQTMTDSSSVTRGVNSQSPSNGGESLDWRVQGKRGLESLRDNAGSKVKKVRFVSDLTGPPVNKGVMVSSSSVSTSLLQVGDVAEIRLLPTSSDSESGWSELKYKVTRIPVTMGEPYVVTEVGKRGPGIYIAECDLRRSINSE